MNWIKDLIDQATRIFQWWVIILPWEMGVRVRFGKGVKILNKGVHFKIPFFDTVYSQTTRLRVVQMAMRTLSTTDKQTLTLEGALGYMITDIETLYETLYHPESTICNIAAGEMASFISQHTLEECTPSKIEAEILAKLRTTDYGITFEYFKVIGYMNVRTYRLIQDQSWIANGLDLEIKK